MGKFVKTIFQYDGLSKVIISQSHKKVLNFQNNMDILKTAIVFIGVSATQNLIIYYLSKAFFHKLDNQISKLNFEKYWKHCLGTSVAASMIAQKVSPQLKYHVFTAGLIHDIGSAVLNKTMPNLIQDVIEVMKKGLSQIEAERKVYDGVTHQDIGAWICRKLNINKDITHIISNHHMEKDIKNKDLSNQVIYIADLISTDYYQRLLGIRVMSALYEKVTVFEFMSKKLTLDISIALPNEVEKVEKFYT